MTTWTVEQIAQAERIYAKVFVDEEVIARAAVDVMAVTRDKMFRNMAGVAHTFGIELHPGDLEFRERPADVEEGEPQFTTRIEARWRPTTKEVELHGGPRDGEVMAFQYAGDPMSRIEIVLPPDLAAIFAAKDEDMTVLPSFRISYSLAGWNEGERRWVYRMVGQ